MEDSYIGDIASTLEHLYLSTDINEVNTLGEKLKTFSDKDIIYVLDNVKRMNEIFYLASISILDRYDKMVDVNKELINAKGDYLRRVFEL